MYLSTPYPLQKVVVESSPSCLRIFYVYTVYSLSYSEVISEIFKNFSVSSTGILRFCISRKIYVGKAAGTVIRKEKDSDIGSADTTLNYRFLNWVLMENCELTPCNVELPSLSVYQDIILDYFDLEIGRNY